MRDWYQLARIQHSPEEYVRRELGEHAYRHFLAAVFRDFRAEVARKLPCGVTLDGLRLNVPSGQEKNWQAVCDQTTDEVRDIDVWAVAAPHEVGILEETAAYAAIQDNTTIDPGGKTWWVACTAAGRMLAWCAAQPHPNGIDVICGDDYEDESQSGGQRFLWLCHELREAWIQEHGLAGGNGGNGGNVTPG